MKELQYKIESKIWLYQGNGAWHFVTISKEISDEIKYMFGEVRRGWGSIRVQVRIGTTTWNTSIFPDKKEGAYLLPLKSEVRKKENLNAGDVCKLVLTVRG